MTFEVKVDDVAGALQTAKRAVEEQGGSLTGGGGKGEFFCKGVQGSYRVSFDDEVEITIEKKTGSAFLISDAAIEKEIRKFFN